MRVIVIGAGRGRRLMPTTADTPKCFAEVGGRRLLDWALDAFAPTAWTRSASSAATRSTRSGATIRSSRFAQNAGLGAQQHPGVAVLRRGLDGRAVHLLLQRRAVYGRCRGAAGGVAGRHGAGRRYRVAGPLRASHGASAGRRREGDGGQRPRDAHPSPDSGSATLTASTSAWRSSRRPARRACASITIAAAKSLPAGRGARRRCSKRRTRFCCFRR